MGSKSINEYSYFRNIALLWRFLLHCGVIVLSHLCHVRYGSNCFSSALQKLQDMDERRVRKLAQGYILFSDTEKHVMPIIGKCLEGITKAGTNVNESNVSQSEQILNGY